MAFTGMNLTDAANVLKTFYIGPVREQLNQGNVLLANLERDTSRTAFRGKEAYIPLHTGRNVGVGARAESGTLPVAGTRVTPRPCGTWLTFMGALLLLVLPLPLRKAVKVPSLSCSTAK